MLGAVGGIMGDIVIRVAGPGDLDAIRDVYRRASLSNEGDRAALLAHPDALDFDPVAVRELRTRVAVDDGRVVGFATTRRDAGGLELDDLFVDPDWMRRGIGLGLVLDAADIARAQGVARITVTANPHALEFYGAAGFVPAGAAETRFGPAPRMHLDVTT
jgi:predicted N-acetyltransferase YhbS